MRNWSERVSEWKPPDTWRRVVAIDAHTEGEPLRVVLGGFPDLGGKTILERRRTAWAEHDGLRRALMWEPRGHADMYGCLVGPPVTSEADIGVLFTHNEGYSTMCGHGIIGVATVLVECGLIDAVEPVTEIGIDTPAGFVRASAHVTGGRVDRVTFINVPSYAAALDQVIEVDGVGPVKYDLGYGGAYYAYVRGADLGLSLVPAEVNRLIELGRRIKDAVQREAPPENPQDSDLGFVYGTIFVGDAHGDAHSRNVCVFADGEVDRCPTGTGVSGRVAIHHARGELALGETIVVESILGTTFTGVALQEVSVGDAAGVVPEVGGRAFITGRNELLIDPADPLREGFFLR